MDSPTNSPETVGNPERSRRRKWKIIGAILAIILLVAGGAAIWALNRYIIDHVKISNVDQYERDQTAGSTTIPIATFPNP